MIARVWHGWTAPDDADRYENLLRAEIFPGIFAKSVAGFRKIELFRRDPSGCSSLIIKFRPQTGAPSYV